LEQIARLRQFYRRAQSRDDCNRVLPEFARGRRDFDMRWQPIKKSFSHGLAPRERSQSKLLKREKGIWQRPYWKHAIRTVPT
jgi:REP-associated tyrosine transposase